MRLFTTACITLLFLLLGTLHSDATHIMGGSLTYKYVGSGKYALELSFYRDCSGNNAAFNPYLTFYIKGKNSTSTSSWNVWKTTTATTVKSAIEDCTSSSFCAQEAYYRDTITLGNDTGGYHLWVPIQARNGAVDNYTVSSQNTYMNWYTFIAPKKFNNSSPTYVKSSVPYICAQRKNIFNAGFYDPDGDSLVFSFAQALNGTGTVPNFNKVPFKTNYSVKYPFGTSSPAIQMDSTTGLISAQANDTGEYVIVVKIDEYRIDPLTKDVSYLGSVLVDLQFVVMNCGTGNKPPYYVPDTGSATRTVYVGDTVRIKIAGKDTNATSSVYDTLTLQAYGSMLGYIPSFPAPYATFTPDTGYKEVSSEFVWVPSCSHVTFGGPHIVTFALEDQGCYVIDTSFSIFVKALSPGVPKFRCLSLVGDSNVKLSWDPVSTDSGFVSYVIYRKKIGATGSTYQKVKTITNWLASEWVDSSAYNVRDTAYEYFFSIVDGCGNEVKASASYTTLLVKNQKVADGKTLFYWSNISTGLKDSFIVYADTGSGMQIVDTVNTKGYLFNYCGKNIKVKVDQILAATSCISSSDTTKAVDVTDSIKPKTGRIFTVNVTQGNHIDLDFINSKSLDIRRYIVYRSVDGGTMSAYDTIINATDTLISYADNNTAADSHYYCYNIVAEDSCGNLTFFGKHCPVYLTATPQNLAIKLQWKKYIGFSPDSIFVERNTGTGWEHYARLNGTDSIYTDKYVTCKPYSYRIRAKETTGSKRVVYSDSIIVSPFDTVPPAPGRIHFAHAPSGTGVNMNYAGTNEKDAKSILISVYRNDTLIAVDTFTAGSSSSYIYFNPRMLNSWNNRYCYATQILDSCGNLSEPHKICLVELTATAANRDAHLNWHPYTGDSVVKYYVYRKRATDSWALVDSVNATDTNYIDKNLECNQRYSYQIHHKVYAAKLATVSTLQSDTSQILTYDTIPPDVPTFRSISVKDDNTITISFSRTFDPDVWQYDVYASTNGGPFQHLKTISDDGSGKYSFDHTGLNTVKNTYCYYMTATDTCNKNVSASSPTQCALQLKATPLGFVSTRLDWNAYPGTPISKYYVERKTQGGSDPFIMIDTVSADSISYIDSSSSLKCNFSYVYRIYAETKDSSFVAYSDTSVAKTYDTVSPARVNIRSVYVLNDTSNLILYEPVPDKDVNRYEIYASKNGGTYTKLATIFYPGSPAVYFHNDINTVKDTFCYRILALDSCANNISATSETHCPIQLSGKAGNTRAELTWTPYQGWDSLHKYYIARLEPTGWVFIDSVGPNVTSYTDLNRGCNLTYTYRIHTKPIIASAFDTSFSDTTRVIPFDTIKPQQVNIRVVNISDTNAYNIVFDTVPDPDVDSYEIYTSKNGGPFQLAGTVVRPTGSPVTFKDTIQPNVLTGQYCFKVIAIDSCADNKSATSEVHCPIQLEGQPMNYANKLTWSKYVGFNKVKNYIVDQFKLGTWTPLATLSDTATSYIHGPIPCKEHVQYRIRGIEDGGTNVAISDSIFLTPFDTQAPEPPVLQYVDQVANNAIYVNWQKSPSIDVYRYNIYRKPSSGGTWVKAGSVIKKFEFTDVFTGADTGSFCYAVEAVDSCVNNVSKLSNEHCNVYLEADTFICYQHIYLNWNAYSGWAAGVNKYNIYKRDKGSSSETFLATVDGTTLTYVDSFVSNKKDFCYRIEAIQQAGSYKSFSAIACAKAYELVKPAILEVSKIATSTTTGEIKIRWENLSKQRFYKYYTLYHMPEDGASFTMLANNIPAVQDTFIHTGINTRTQDHYYYITVTDTCDNLSVDSDSHKSINIQAQVGQLLHEIQWTPYIGWPVKNYVIERLETSGYEVIKTVPGTDTATTVFPAPCNYNIFYRIKAEDAVGNFAYSDTIGKQAIDTIKPNPVLLRNASVVSHNNVKLDFRGSDSLDMYQYVVQRAVSGTWGTAGTIPFATPGQEHSYNDLTNIADNKLSYTIVSLDSCLNATFSDTFSPIQLIGTPLQQAVSLKWHPFEGYDLKEYKILYHNGTGWDTIATKLPGDTTQLYDSLHCNIPYIYKIIGVKDDGTLTTLSDSSYLVPFDTVNPPPAKMRYVTVQPNGKIRLEWEYDTKSDVKYFEIWKRVNKNPFQQIDLVIYDSVYIDAAVNTYNNSYSYFIVSIDSCDFSHRSVPSDTDRTMEVRLSTRACVPLIRINWDSYKELYVQTHEYRLYRSEDGGSTWMLRGTFDRFANNFVDSNVTVTKAYCYRVEAVDLISGYTSYSAQYCLQPWVYPIPKPSAVTHATVSKTGTSDGIITLYWQPYDTLADSFARGYNLYHNDGSGFYLLERIEDLSLSEYVHKGVNTESGINSYYLAVFNLCEEEGDSVNFHRVVNLDGVNKNLEIQLNWSDYFGRPVVSYDLFKSFDGSIPVRIGSFKPGTTSYNDTNISCDKIYTYTIRAVLNNGKITWSDSVAFKAFDTIPPAVPNMFSASVDTTLELGGKISILYKGNNEKNRSGYNLYRSVNGGAYAFVRFIPETANDTLYWQDQSLNTKKDLYSYYFTSVDSCGNETIPSDTHTVVHLQAKAFSQFIKLDWTAYKGFNSFGYVIERKDSTGKWRLLKAMASGQQAYHDSDVHCFHYYDYRIKTVDASGKWLSFSNIAGDTAYEFVAPLPEEMTRVTVEKTATREGEILIEWGRSPSSDIAAYNVYRSIDQINWDFVTKVWNKENYLDRNKNTKDVIYYYTVAPVDTCDNEGVYYDPPHRTIVLHATAGNQQITLDWNKYQSWATDRHDIFRDGELYATIGGGSTSYIDTMVLCTRSYQYQVVAVSEALGRESYSNTDEAKPWDSKAPAAPYVIEASVDVPNEVARIEWRPSGSFDAKYYHIYRRSGENGRITFVDSTAATYYLDNKAIDKPDCYFVYASDHCGNVSVASNRACLIILNGRQGSGISKLTWNQYEQWASEVDYYNIYRNDDSSGWHLVDTTHSLAYIDEDLSGEDIMTYCYQVEAIEKDTANGGVSRSTVVCLHQDPVVYIPNSFSPGASFDINDKFAPIGTYIHNYKMTIYNRWGETIYTTEDGEPWDGTRGGELMPQGVYIYVITVQSNNRTDQVIKGDVTLLR